MEKLAIIGFCNLNIMQYLYKYTHVLDEQGIDYDVVYWNRLGIEESTNFQGNKICYEKPLDTYQPFHKKILSFVRYARFMYRTIKENRYDKLIVLTTQTAFSLLPLLCGKYRGKYIYDYRDVTAEQKLPLFAAAVRRLIQNSALTMMSSMGFLPEIGVEKTDKICMAHNTQLAQRQTDHHLRLSQASPLRITFWGIVRQLEFSRKLCDIFGNDQRFVLTYHGTGFYQELAAYCEEKQYTNIHFTGGYSREQIPGFAAQTDILNCVYENNANTKPTLAVKAYDAIKYRLPVLFNAGSYVSSFLGDFPAQCTFDESAPDRFPDQVLRWYQALDAERAEAAFARVEQQIYEDDIQFSARLRAFVKSAAE